MEHYLSYLRELNFASMLLRLALSIAAGGLIGFERERKGRPAGFRTYMLVAMGAALTMMLGQYFSIMLHGEWAGAAGGAVTDVSRFGAQVINGVGFLGAGTIIVTGRQEVKGLTTAAGLWASACMGLAIGAGFYECMLVGFLLVLMCMNLLPLVEERALSDSRNMNIYLELDSMDNLSSIVNHLKAGGIRIFDLELNREQHEHMRQLSALFSLHLPRRQPHTEILAILSKQDGIITIEEV